MNNLKLLARFAKFLRGIVRSHQAASLLSLSEFGEKQSVVEEAGHEDRSTIAGDIYNHHYQLQDLSIDPSFEPYSERLPPNEIPTHWKELSQLAPVATWISTYHDWMGGLFRDFFKKRNTKILPRIAGHLGEDDLEKIGTHSFCLNLLSRRILEAEKFWDHKTPESKEPFGSGSDTCSGNPDWTSSDTPTSADPSPTSTHARTTAIHHPRILDVARSPSSKIPERERW